MKHEKMTYEKAKKDIQDLLKTNPNGDFTHNIISMTLACLAKEEGNQKANDLVDELNLPYKKAAV